MWKSDKLHAFLSKKRNISLLYIIISICIVFLAVSGRADKAETTTTTPAAQVSEQPLDMLLEEVLSSLEGTENVQVAVTFDSSVETVPAKNKNGDSETVVTLGTGSAARLAAEKEIMPRVRGVVVLARGAENPKVRENILSCVQALTGAPAHTIGVFPAK